MAAAVAAQLAAQAAAVKQSNAVYAQSAAAKQQLQYQEWSAGQGQGHGHGQGDDTVPSWLAGGYGGGRRSSINSRLGEPSVGMSAEAWARKRAGEILAKAREEVAEEERSKVGRNGVGIAEVRAEKWAAMERAGAAMSELRKLEREFRRIDSHAAHIDSKIERLRGYSKFIEDGWEDKAEEAEGDGEASDERREGMDDEGGAGGEHASASAREISA